MIEPDELRKRIIYSINPRNTTNLLAAIEEKPDIYGPFWICTFVIFGGIIASSLITVLQRIFVQGSHKEVSYKYEKIGFEFCVVYGFLFGFPAVTTIILKILGSDTFFIRVSLNSK